MWIQKSNVQGNSSASIDPQFVWTIVKFVMESRNARTTTMKTSVYLTARVDGVDATIPQC